MIAEVVRYPVLKVKQPRRRGGEYELLSGPGDVIASFDDLAGARAYLAQCEPARREGYFIRIRPGDLQHV